MTLLDSQDVRTRVRLWTQYLHNRIHYARAAPRPRRLLYIDPTCIEHTYFPLLHTTVSDVTKENTHVLGGEWDRVPVSDREWFSIGALDEGNFEGRRRLRLDRYAFHDLLTSGIESEEKFLERWVDIVEKFPAAADTKYADPEYMRRYFDLYHTIKESGYKQGAELGRASPYPEFDEVGVYIGRNGSVHSAGFGKHRLVIAQQLGLDSIPVRVNVRHERWQARRNAFYRDDASTIDFEAYTSHPDMQSLTG